MTEGSSAGSYRRRIRRIGRPVFGVAAVMALMATFPAVASAALTVNSVSLATSSGSPGSALTLGINSGAYSATTNPNGIRRSTATVTRSGTTNNLLRSYRYYYDGDTSAGLCVDVASGQVVSGGYNSTSGAIAFNVYISLPGTAGPHPLSFVAYSANGCGGTGSNTFSVPGGVTVTPSTAVTSPHKELECGLRVALVLDESLSITDSEVRETKDAAKAFVGALDDTGASVAIIAFAQTARPIVPNYTQVTGTSIATTFNPAIENNFAGPGAARSGTNWDGAFRAVSGLSGGVPDLVVFMTDGDPNGTNLTASTAPSGAPSAGFTTDLDGGLNVMAAATTAANAVKAPSPGVTGSRVFAIGVGAVLNNPAGVVRLEQVSGPHEGTDVEHDEYTTLRHFAELEGKLKDIVAGLCGGTLTITKTVTAPPGVDAERSGWTFRAEMTESPGHVWLTPALTPPAERGPSATLTSGPDGEITFRWRLTGPGDAKLTVVKETEKTGFHMGLAGCQLTESNGHVTQLRQRTTGTTIATDLTIPARGHATCEVENIRTMAHLTIIKRLEPQHDPGRFDLLLDGRPVRQGVDWPGGSTGRLALPTGRYDVGERVSADSPTTLADYDTSTTCVNYNGTIPRPRVSGVGTEDDPVSVDLRSAIDNWVCTITNTSTRFGTLRLEKHLVPSHAPGAFDLLVNGRVERAGARDGQGVTLPDLPFGDYTVSEEVAARQTVTLADYEIGISCVDESADPAVELPGFPATGPIAPPVTLSRDHSDILCIITNVHIPTPVAHLEVVKHLVPAEDSGLFDLRVDGTTFATAARDGDSTGTLPFELGTYKVSETATTGTPTNLADYDVSTTCENTTTGKKVHGVGTDTAPVSVRLAHETDDWVCTITNTRKAPPTEPGGGGDQPELCDEINQGIAECGEVERAPHLFVVKQMPASARVGDRVPIKITVTNIGPETARQVRLHETPPPGGRIEAAANRGSIQSDGTVVWNLGDLAPGGSRTVHATMLITATGAHTDTAAASAANADPAFDVATVRGAPARRPPPFTG